jgi:hypothetical protein
MSWVAIKAEEVAEPEMDSSDVLGVMAEIGLPLLGGAIGLAFGNPMLGASMGYTAGQYAKAGLADDPRESMRYASQGTQGLLTTAPYAWDAIQDYQKNIIPPPGPKPQFQTASGPKIPNPWLWQNKPGATDAAAPNANFPVENPYIPIV